MFNLVPTRVLLDDTPAIDNFSLRYCPYIVLRRIEISCWPNFFAVPPMKRLGIRALSITPTNQISMAIRPFSGQFAASLVLKISHGVTAFWHKLISFSFFFSISLFNLSSVDASSTCMFSGLHPDPSSSSSLRMIRPQAILSTYQGRGDRLCRVYL